VSGSQRVMDARLLLASRRPSGLQLAANTCSAWPARATVSRPA